MQLVGAASQCTQLFGGLFTVVRLAEPRRAACECLIGAKDDPSWQSARDLVRFGAGEMARYRGRVGSARLRFHGPFIDLRRSYLEAQSSRRENLAADIAF